MAWKASLTPELRAFARERGAGGLLPEQGSLWLPLAVPSSAQLGASCHVVPEASPPESGWGTPAVTRGLQFTHKWEYPSPSA